MIQRYSLLNWFQDLSAPWIFEFVTNCILRVGFWPLGRCYFSECYDELSIGWESVHFLSSSSPSWLSTFQLLCRTLMTVKNSHEPNMRGHDCQSMGKLESIIGHLALMVSRMLYVMSPSSEILAVKSQCLSWPPRTCKTSWSIDGTWIVYLALWWCGGSCRARCGKMYLASKSFPASSHSSSAAILIFQISQHLIIWMIEKSRS